MYIYMHNATDLLCVTPRPTTCTVRDQQGAASRPPRRTAARHASSIQLASNMQYRGNTNTPALLQYLCVELQQLTWSTTAVLLYYVGIPTIDSTGSTIRSRGVLRDL